MKGIYNWLGKHARTSYGPLIFFILTFIEGFFIVPVSSLLAFYCLENRKKSFFYGTVATIGSAVAALTGYFLGVLLWKSAGTHIINYLIAKEKFDYLVTQYKTYQSVTVFITALTPMPFKALTLTAGFCRIPIVSFIIFTIIARGIRFYFISGSIYFWGDQVNYYLKKYFYYILALGIISLILMIWLIH